MTKRPCERPRTPSRMWVVADQRDLLEDTMYRRLFTLWDEFADAQVVFDDHGSDNHFCAQKV